MNAVDHLREIESSFLNIGSLLLGGVIGAYLGTRAAIESSEWVIPCLALWAGLVALSAPARTARIRLGFHLGELRRTKKSAEKVPPWAKHPLQRLRYIRNEGPEFARIKSAMATLIGLEQITFNGSLLALYWAMHLAGHSNEIAWAVAGVVPALMIMSVLADAVWQFYRDQAIKCLLRDEDGDVATAPS